MTIYISRKRGLGRTRTWTVPVSRWPGGHAAPLPRDALNARHRQPSCAGAPLSARSCDRRCCRNSRPPSPGGAARGNHTRRPRVVVQRTLLGWGLVAWNGFHRLLRSRQAHGDIECADLRERSDELKAAHHAVEGAPSRLPLLAARAGLPKPALIFYRWLIRHRHHPNWGNQCDSLQSVQCWRASRYVAAQ